MSYHTISTLLNQRKNKYFLIRFSMCICSYKYQVLLTLISKAIHNKINIRKHRDSGNQTNNFAYKSTAINGKWTRQQNVNLTDYTRAKSDIYCISIFGVLQINI